MASPLSDPGALPVAIVHDSLFAFGGAERVLTRLMALYPEAPVFTFYANPHDPRILALLHTGRIRCSFFRYFPLYALGRYYSIFKLVSWVYFLTLDLRGYRAVISSSYGFGSPLTRTGSARHIAYVHTPPRYLYGLTNELRFVTHGPLSVIFSPVRSLMASLDRAGMRRPHVLLCNSATVRKRIRTLHGREAKIVYPPVKIPPAAGGRQRGYFLVHSRLERQKYVDCVVKTCTDHGLPLVVVGEGSMMGHLRRMAGPSVRFLGWVPDNRMGDVYAHASALLSCARDEDFGLTVVEAMANGVPVIAYGSGGVAETVLDGKTGILFTDMRHGGLYRAIMRFKRKRIAPAACRERAKKYGEHQFDTAIRAETRP